MAKKASASDKKSFWEYVLLWGTVLIFAVLPLLYFSDRAASYVTSKEYFFIGTVDVLTVVWVWLQLGDHHYRLTKRNWLFLLPLLLFLVSLTISAFAGVDPATSFFSTVESGTGLLLLYHAFLFACILVSLIRVRGQKMVTYIIQANLLASVVLAIFTFYTGVHGVIDVNSTMLDGSSGGAMMGNSLLVGAYFIFSIFLTLIAITQEKKLYKNIVYVIGIIVLVLSPIYTNAAIWKGHTLSTLSSSGYFILGEARIAAIALVIGLLVSLCIWLTLHTEKKVLKNIGIAGLVVGTVLAVVTIRDIATPNTHLNQFFVAQAGNRTIDWQEAAEGIKAKPVLGWGPENFHVVYQQYLNPIVFSPGHGNEVWALHPHNNTLEVLVDGGILGFLLYLLVLAGIVTGITQLYKKNIMDRATVALLAGMFIAFFIQQQMIYDSIVSYVMFFSMIAIIAGLLAQNDEPRRYGATAPMTYVIGAGIVIIMFPIWLYAAYLPAQKVDEFQAVANAHSDARTGMYQHLFHSPGSYAIDTDIEFYTDPLFFSYQAQEQILRANPTYQKVASQELSALFAAVAPVWVTKPYDYHLTLSLVQLENLQFYLTGDTKQLANADIYAQHALILSPTDPQIYFAYAQTLVYEHKTPQAIAMLNKAIALNANYQSAVVFKKMLE